MFDLKVNIVPKISITSLLKQKDIGIAKSLLHAGSIIRKAAQASMVPGNGKASRPGNPPHMQSGRLKKSILFAVEDGRVIIGPAKRTRAFYGDILEKGGRYPVAVKRRGRKTGVSRKGQVIFFPARPYMQPALLSNLSRLPLSFRANLIS